MLALAVASLAVALLAVLLVLPTYRGTARTPWVWTAGFVFAETVAALAALGALIDADDAATRAVATVGTATGTLAVGTAGASFATFVLGGRRREALLDVTREIHDDIRPPMFGRHRDDVIQAQRHARGLPPFFARDSDCLARPSYGERNEVSDVQGRLAYWFEVDPVVPDAVLIQAVASTSYWWGLGTRLKRLQLDAALHISCASQNDGCAAQATVLGRRSLSSGPLRLAIACEIEPANDALAATIEIGAALQGRTKPEISAGFPGVVTAKIGWPGAAEESSVGMGRFRWRCSSS